MLTDATRGKIEQYEQDIASGDILACRAVRQAIERQRQDLGRQDSTDFPYYFDDAAGLRACRFFPAVLRHSIGEYAGLPFELEPWQAWGIYVLFGWKRIVDETRRYRRFYDSQGRKNGKTTRAAGLAILLAMADINPVTRRPEQVAEVILAATKKEQVERVMYAEIERMRLQAPAIEARSVTKYKSIEFAHNKGLIRCVGTQRPYDGLNPHAVLMDELHTWREHHRSFWDTMQTGSGARSQALLGSLTTAGHDKSHLWLEEYTYALGVLDGTIKDDTYFAYIFQLDAEDDPLDESVWGKANPNLGVSLKIEYLREQPKATAADLNRFRRYHCNLVVRNVDVAFDLARWDKCQGKLADWNAADAIGGGVDLGGRDDLAAWALCAKFATGEEIDGEPIYRYELRTQAYIADDTDRDLSRQPWATWCHTEQVRRVKYVTASLLADLKARCAEYGVWQVAYDRYNAAQLGEELDAAGIRAGEAAQSFSWFNEAILEFQKALKDGRLAHTGSPVLRWCVNNAVLKHDPQDRLMFDKGSSDDKIDVIVAAVMAFRMASTAPLRAIGSLYL